MPSSQRASFVAIRTPRLRSARGVLRARRALWALPIALLIALPGASPASAQINSPVAVDDSPWAWETLQRAADQAVRNPVEAARLIERVLEEQARKLVPWPGDEGPGEAVDRYRTVRSGANELLRANPLLLARWRAGASVAAAERLARGELERVTTTALLTPAGLEAAMRLAQADFERGRFHAALLRLEEVGEHPDLDDGRLALLETIRGMALAGLGDAESALATARLVESIDAPRSPESAAAIERMAAQVPFPQRERGLEPLGEGTPLVESDEPWHLLHAVALPTTLATRVPRAFEEMGRFTPRNLEQMVQRGSLLTTAPTVVGALAIVNEGGVVRGIDRLSGRVQWQRELPFFDFLHDGTTPADLGTVAAEGDLLVTVAGHAVATARLGGDRIVCLEVDTGAIRWATSLGRLDGGFDESEGLYPHGAPVIEGGAVHLLARKVTNRLETVSYVVALDLRDGRPLWSQYICASAGIRFGGYRQFSTLVAEEGVLHVSTPTGAVASLTASTGEVRWLRRLPVPTREPRYDAEPWEIAAALPTSAGVIAMAPDQLHAVVLGPRDGTLRARRTLGAGEPWGLARYALRVRPTQSARRELVAVVGSDLVLFDSEDLGRPLWRLSERRPDLADGDERSGLRGRVQVAGRSLLVPTTAGVLVMEAEDGGVRTTIPATTPANVVACGAQMVAATNRQLEVLMPLGEAESYLRERLAERADDPERGLALLGLGLGAGRVDLCLEGGRAAVAALGAMGTRSGRAAAQEEIFDRLLRVDGLLATSGEAGRAAGDELHELLASVAETQPQRARQLLARGAWLAREPRRRAEAVDAWCALLEDGIQGAMLVPVDGVERSAWLLASARLGALVAEDSVAAARLAARGRERLERLEAEPSIAALLAVSDAAPGTDESIAATERALRRAASEGGERAAMRIAEDAWRRHEALAAGFRGPQRERLAALVAEAIRGAGAPVRAAAFLSAHGPPGDDRATDAATALRPPRIGRLSGSAIERTGRLLRPLGGGAQLLVATADASGALLHDDGALRSIGPDLAEQWSIPLDDPDPRLLRLDGASALLWSFGSGDPRALLVDRRSGALLWESSSMSELLPPPAARAIDPAGGAPPVDLSEILPLGGPGYLIAVRRCGDATRLRLDSGAPAWVRRGILGQVSAVWSDDALLLVGGIDGTGRAELVAIDAVGGEVLARVRPASGTRILWCAGTPTGLMLLGTETGVEAFELRRDGPAQAWIERSIAAAGTTAAWLVGTTLATAGAAEQLGARRALDGSATDAFALPAQLEGILRIRDLVVDDDGVIALFDQRLVVFDRAGSVLGIDATADERDFRGVVGAADRLLVVGAVGEQVDFTAPSRTQYAYRIHALDRAQGCKLIGSAMQIGSAGARFDRLAAMDGWLLLSNGTTVTAIPMREGLVD